jgi:hypothetical protein
VLVPRQVYKLEYRVLDLGISQQDTRSAGVRGNVPWLLDLGISQQVTRSVGVRGNVPWKIPADRQVNKLEYRVLDLGIVINRVID